MLLIELVKFRAQKCKPTPISCFFWEKTHITKETGSRPGKQENVWITSIHFPPSFENDKEKATETTNHLFY